jgi:peptidase E
MQTLSFNTVEVKLSRTELKSYFERFGNRYWNDTENVIFIPIAEFVGDNKNLEHKFYRFFSGIGNNVSGVYINCNKCE